MLAKLKLLVVVLRVICILALILTGVGISSIGGCLFNALIWFLRKRFLRIVFCELWIDNGVEGNEYEMKVVIVFEFARGEGKVLLDGYVKMFVGKIYDYEKNVSRKKLH